MEKLKGDALVDFVHSPAVASVMREIYDTMEAMRNSYRSGLSPQWPSCEVILSSLSVDILRRLRDVTEQYKAYEIWGPMHESAIAELARRHET